MVLLPFAQQYLLFQTAQYALQFRPAAPLFKDILSFQQLQFQRVAHQRAIVKQMIADQFVHLLKLQRKQGIFGFQRVLVRDRRGDRKEPFGR